MTKRESQLREYVAEQKVYGMEGERLRLTDEERDVIEFCAEWLRRHSKLHGDILLHLLERTK